MHAPHRYVTSSSNWKAAKLNDRLSSQGVSVGDRVSAWPACGAGEGGDLDELIDELKSSISCVKTASTREIF